MLGDRIGAYTIQKKLGEGGMGSVYLAEHALLGRRAAIKVLLPSMSANQEVVNRFFNEARATTSIVDPGIVQVFDFGYHTDGSAYIVMELLDGESLAARLQRLGRLQVRDALRLLRQIATSLGAAHARGIVHRDLKPDNLFVVGDPAVTGGERTKILDFGIAKLSGDDPGRLKTRTGSVMGTPVFMSPEQCRGVSNIDHRADIYSLGCVMFVCVTGRPPFDGEGVGDILFAHMGVPPPVPSSLAPLPPIVDQIVLRCMAKAPGDRYASMQDLANAMLAAEQQMWTAPTPAPTSGVMPATIIAPSSPHIPATTTFSGATGQVSSTSSKGGRGLWLALSLLVVGGAIVAIAVVARGGSDERAAPAAAAAQTETPPPPSSIDASVVAPTPIDASIAASEPAIVDAGVTIVDAAVASAPIDAAPNTKSTRIKSTRTKAKASASDVDRGD